MLLKELNSNGFGIFKDVFKTNFNIEYAELFDNLDPDVLDSMLNLNYGQRNVISNIDDSNKQLIIKQILTINVQRWIKIKNLLYLQYDVSNPKFTESKTGTIKTDNDSTLTGLNGVKPFNEQNFTDNEKEESEKNQTETKTFNTTNIKEGSTNSDDIITSIQKEIEFRTNTDNYKYVLSDISNMLTLKIY